MNAELLRKSSASGPMAVFRGINLGAHKVPCQPDPALASYWVQSMPGSVKLKQVQRIGPRVILVGDVKGRDLISLCCWEPMPVAGKRPENGQTGTPTLIPVSSYPQLWNM